LADTQRLYRFLAPKNKAAAQRAITAIRHGVKMLEAQPEAGRPLDDLDPNFREWIIDFGGSGYVVLYHFNGHDSVILAVRHQKETGY
jgi:plasmid stabilization system protein ParE